MMMNRAADTFPSYHEDDHNHDDDHDHHKRKDCKGRYRIMSKSTERHVDSFYELVIAALTGSLAGVVIIDLLAKISTTIESESTTFVVIAAFGFGVIALISALIFHIQE